MNHELLMLQDNHKAEGISKTPFIYTIFQLKAKPQEVIKYLAAKIVFF